MPTNVADTMNMAAAAVLNIAVFLYLTYAYAPVAQIARIVTTIMDVNGGHRRVGIVRMNAVMAAFMSNSCLVYVIDKSLMEFDQLMISPMRVAYQKQSRLEFTNPANFFGNHHFGIELVQSAVQMEHAIRTDCR